MIQKKTLNLKCLTSPVPNTGMMGVSRFKIGHVTLATPFWSWTVCDFLLVIQEGHHPLTEQRAANFRLLANQWAERRLVTQWRHGCRAMRRSVCNAGASNGGRFFAFRYQGNGATTCQYIDTTRKAIDCATTLPLRVFTARRNARIASAVLATAIPSVCPSVRPSVCPSVTRRYCVKTTARSTVQFALSDSKMCLVL